MMIWFNLHSSIRRQDKNKTEEALKGPPALDHGISKFLMRIFLARAPRPGACTGRPLTVELHPQEEFKKQELTDGLCFFFPDRRKLHDGFHGLLHVLDTHPFLLAVKSMLACINIGAWQAHERKPRAIGAAPDA